jgi:predicted secreted protein with PEFG-CTERM motif
MDYRISIIMIFPLIIICAPAFAQDASMTLSTDSPSYVSGDAIVVSGNVGIYLIDTPIVVQIWHENTLVDVAQETVAGDGGFSATFRAQGPLWSSDGVYTVRVSYGVDNILETTFNFYGDVDLSTIQLDEKDVSLPDGGTFDVGYMIKGGEVTEMEIIPENFSIVTTLSTNSNGYIVLELPTDQILSQKMDGTNEAFIVLVYETADDSDIGIQTSYEEIKSNDDTRTIKIPFNLGDKKIEVIGTWAVPEFGAIAGLVLAAAIISIIILSAKTRLDVIPRF